VDADPANRRGRPQPLVSNANGWNMLFHERSDPVGHRGNDDGMSVQGDPSEHGKPQVVRARDPQPDAREGLAGPLGVAERPVVLSTPGNSGRGKGPWFKVNAASGGQPGDWHEPITSTKGWEVADGVAHQSEELAWLSVLRPV